MVGHDDITSNPPRIRLFPGGENNVCCIRFGKDGFSLVGVDRDKDNNNLIASLKNRLVNGMFAPDFSV